MEKNTTIEKQHFKDQLYPLKLRKKQTQSLDLNFQNFGIAQSNMPKQYRHLIKYQAMWIQNTTGQKLFNFFLIHRCSRVAPNLCNIFYKKILKDDDDKSYIDNWPYLQEPYSKDITNKDVIQIYFSIELDEKIIPFTNFGQTSLQIEVPFSKKSKQIQIRIEKIQLQPTKQIFGSVHYYAQIKNQGQKQNLVKINLSPNVSVYSGRHQANYELQKIVRQIVPEQQQKSVKNIDLFQDINFQAKLMFIASTQLKALINYRLNYYKGKFQENSIFRDKFPPRCSRKASLTPIKQISYDSLTKINSKDNAKRNRPRACFGQGQLDNCYLIVVLDQFISQAPEVLNEIIIFFCSKTSYVCIVLNVEGCWIPIEIDQDLPATQEQQYLIYKNFFFYYSHIRRGKLTNAEKRLIKNSMYIQKCLAKVFRSYTNLSFGTSVETFMNIANLNTKKYQMGEKRRQDLQLLKKMQEWNKNSKKNVSETKVLITVAALHEKQIPKEAKQKILKKYTRQYTNFHNHAYSFYGINEIQAYHVRIVRLRNSVGDMAAYWMKKWKQQNKQVYKQWKIINKGSLQSEYQFLIDFEDLVALKMKAYVSEYNYNNTYLFVPLYMKHRKQSKIHLHITKQGQYYFSLHKKNLRSDLQQINHKYQHDQEEQIKQIKQKVGKKNIKGRLILKQCNSESRHTLQAEDKQLITYIRCYLYPGYYELLAAIENSNEPNLQQFLYVSALGSGIQQMQEVYLTTAQSIVDLYQEQLSNWIQWDINPTFVTELSEEQPIFKVEVTSNGNSDLLIELAEMGSYSCNLLRFTLQRIDSYKFGQWQGPVQCTNFMQIHSGDEYFSLIFFIKHELNGKFKLNIQLGQEQIWRRSRKVIVQSLTKQAFSKSINGFTIERQLQIK